MTPAAPLRLVPPSAIPAELRETDRWLAWRLLHGKKPPVDDAGRPMSTWQEPDSWLSFAAAKKRANGLDGQAGVGFVLGDGFSGLDLDDCRDPGNGDIGPQAKAVIAFAEGAYAEVSPSGKGVKVFGRGEGWLEITFRKDAVTVDRKATGYFCVTGNVYRVGKIVALPLDDLVTHFGQKKVGAKKAERATALPPDGAEVRPGQQNPWLFKRACMWVSRGMSDYEDVIGQVRVEAKRCPDALGEAKWDERDYETIARSALRYAGERSVIDELNERFFLVDIGADTVVAEEVEETNGTRKWTTFLFRSFADFKRKLVKYKVDKKPAAEIWLNAMNGLQYERLVYAPPGAIKKARPEDLNGWRGFTVEPTAGSYTKIEAFIRDVVCDSNKQLYDWLFNWTAALFQKPGRHGETALILLGPEGVGKNFFAETILGQTFDGRHALTTTHTHQVLGEFNSILSGLAFLVLDEAGLKTKAEAGKMRGLVTAHVLDVNRKGIDVDRENSMLHFVFLTNDEKAPLPIGAEDRRFTFFRVGRGRQQDIRFFADLHKAIEGGERAAYLAALLDHKVDWNATRVAPRTDAKDRVKRANWSPSEWFIYRYLRKEDRWTGERQIVKAEFVARFATYLEDQRLTSPDPISDLAETLREMFGNERWKKIRRRDPTRESRRPKPMDVPIVEGDARRARKESRRRASRSRRGDGPGDVTVSIGHRASRDVTRVTEGNRVGGYTEATKESTTYGQCNLVTSLSLSLSIYKGGGGEERGNRAGGSSTPTPVTGLHSNKSLSHIVLCVTEGGNIRGYTGYRPSPNPGAFCPGPRRVEAGSRADPLRSPSPPSSSAAQHFDVCLALYGASPLPGRRYSPRPFVAPQSEVEDAQTRFYAERGCEGTLRPSKRLRVNRALFSPRVATQ